MELKSTLEFEIIKNEKSYRFYIPAGAPFGEAYDAAFEVLEMILKLTKEGADKVQKNKEEVFKAVEEAAVTEKEDDSEEKESAEAK